MCTLLIDMHKDIIHRTGNVNNLDMLADKVIEDVKKVFEGRIKKYRGIENKFGVYENNRYYMEKVISFAIDK